MKARWAERPTSELERGNQLWGAPRAHWRTRPCAQRRTAHRQTHFLLHRGKQREKDRERARETQTSNSPMWTARVWGYGIFPPSELRYFPLSPFFSLSVFHPVVFLWESCSARREVWLFAWSAEEEEEEAKSRVKSGGRWSATPLGEEACCASWCSVSALRPRRAKLGFTPTTGQSG